LKRDIDCDCFAKLSPNIVSTISIAAGKISSALMLGCLHLPILYEIFKEAIKVFPFSSKAF